jgi:hypothetical protein
VTFISKNKFFDTKKFILPLFIVASTAVGFAQTYRQATATATMSGGFVVGANVTDGGAGYTNVPLVHVIGGAGSNAVLTASVNGGAVINLSVSNPGQNYNSTPQIIIAPPVAPVPQINVSMASYLSFSSLQMNFGIGDWTGVYFFMKNISGVWSNQTPANTYIASPGYYNTIVDGTATTNTYALALFPIPIQATATAQVTNGFITKITVNNNGLGYKSAPSVQIFDTTGSGAQATASAAAQQFHAPEEVSSITVNSPGSGYSSSPTVIIGPPDATLQLTPPTTITPMVRIDLGNLGTNLNYQLQSSPNLTDWMNLNASFLATSSNSTSYYYATNVDNFFRLEYIP